MSAAIKMDTDFLFDEEDGDMRGNGYLSHCNMAKERGLSDTYPFRSVPHSSYPHYRGVAHRFARSNRTAVHEIRSDLRLT